MLSFRFVLFGQFVVCFGIGKFVLCEVSDLDAIGFRVMLELDTFEKGTPNYDDS